MGWIGYEVFNDDPGKVKSKKCRVCGSKCLVERNIKGATSWGAAMCGTSKLHDCFTCPHVGDPWHEHALALFKQAEDSASKRVAAIINEELKGVVAAGLGESRKGRR
jgi:hypothetical protein